MRATQGALSVTVEICDPPAFTLSMEICSYLAHSERWKLTASAAACLIRSWSALESLPREILEPMMISGTHLGADDDFRNPCVLVEREVFRNFIVTGREIGSPVVLRAVDDAGLEG